MSTNMQTITPKAPDTSSSASGKTGGGLGLNLSSGMEAAVTAALSFLEQILCKINNQELEESKGMATAIQDSSEYSAQSTIQNGVQQFIDALAEGIGSIGSCALTLGTMGIGELRDPTKSQFKQLDQEQAGIENVQKAIPKTANPNANELLKDPVYGPDTEAVARVKSMTPEERTEALNKKIQALKGQKSFVDQEGNALKVSDEDAELLKTMDQGKAKALNDKLEERLDDLSKRRGSLAEQQSRNRNTHSTIGQALGTAAQGTGKSIGAFTKEAQAQDQADAQLSNSAVQGMQAILAQLVKTANDALSQAQQTIQTFATISNGNKFQG
ncbi:MAG: hypothetical protein H7A41_01045 [Chlamydiales bacterium]|nr:hypothetical protein [Chlamydiales bacterium]